jgi:hypothetical protein
MHTTELLNGWRVHHHGDFSGNVIFSNGKKELEIPFDSVKELVAVYVRERKQEQLEDKLDNSSDDELLGLKSD